MKRVLLILFALMTAWVSSGQRRDSLSCHYDHSFRLPGTLAPALLITSGSILAGSEYLNAHFDIPIHDWSQRDGHDRFEVEDYLQYSPLLAVPAMKLCGFESQHSWRNLVNLTAGACLLNLTFSHGLKHILRRERPYGGVYTSFPSGHTTTAFMGAEILRREYGKEYPGVAVAGYVVATGVGCMRVYNNRHWASDVLAGAGFGILSASLMYWLAPYLQF